MSEEIELRKGQIVKLKNGDICQVDINFLYHPDYPFILFNLSKLAPFSLYTKAGKHVPYDIDKDVLKILEDVNVKEQIAVIEDDWHSTNGEILKGNLKANQFVTPENTLMKIINDSENIFDSLINTLIEKHDKLLEIATHKKIPHKCQVCDGKGVVWTT